MSRRSVRDAVEHRLADYAGKAIGECPGRTSLLGLGDVTPVCGLAARGQANILHPISHTKCTTSYSSTESCHKPHKSCLQNRGEI